MKEKNLPTHSHKGLVLVNKAITLKNQKKYDEALKLYDEVIELKDDPYIPKAWYNKGLLLHQELGKFKDAIHCYKEAVKLDPDYLFAWNNLAVVLLNIENYEEALQAVERALEIDNSAKEPLRNKAIILNRLGKNHNEVISILIDTLKDEPENIQIHRELGIAYSNLQQFKKALVHFEKAFAMEPGHYQTCFSIGFVKDALQEFEEAIEFYDKAIDIDPTNFKAYKGKGVALIRIGKVKEAQPLIEKTIQLNPADFEGYYNLACIFALLKEKNKLLDTLKKTLEYSPKHMLNFIKEHIKQDPDFSNYLEDADFLKLLS